MRARPGAAARASRPYHDTTDVNGGGPHSDADARATSTAGKMDGFVRTARAGRSATAPSPTTRAARARTRRAGRDGLPRRRARSRTTGPTRSNFVLQDHMFEPDASWSLPAHLFMVSGVVGALPKPDDPLSCQHAAERRRRCRDSERRARRRRRLRVDRPHLAAAPAPRELALLRRRTGRARLRGRRDDLPPDHAGREHAGHLEPAAVLRHRHQDGQLGNIQPIDDFFTAARTGTLPAVSWIVPDRQRQRAPAGARLRRRRRTSRGSMNAVMRGPDWNSTAIFLTWDDWGGFYDHVVPPQGRRARLRPARSRPRDQPVRQAAATSTTRRSASTPT